MNYDSMWLHDSGPIMKDFFWKLIMLIFSNLTYVKNKKTSLDKIIKLTFRFKMAVGFCEF